jgi:hypothetical protein
MSQAAAQVLGAKKSARSVVALATLAAASRASRARALGGAAGNVGAAAEPIGISGKTTTTESLGRGVLESTTERSFFGCSRSRLFPFCGRILEKI